jgi:hypothetical protein
MLRAERLLEAATNRDPADRFVWSAGCPVDAGPFYAFSAAATFSARCDGSGS